MRCERRVLSGDPAGLASELRGLVPGGESVSAAVAEIVAAVRSGGDEAVLDYTERFDLGGAQAKSLRVNDAETATAADELDPAVRRALRRATENVRRVAEASLRRAVTVDFGSHTVALRREPVTRAAVYVPGGRAPYPSTVIMGVVPARVAGVSQVAVCTPPGDGGEIPPVIAAACGLTGASELYRMGGAQAIAALAFGTESVEPVDVIVGPGNLYVQEAKRQVSGQLAIDGFAGPSDLLVIADEDVDPGLVSLDLLAQAEHGPGTLVAALSPSETLLGSIGERLEAGGASGAVAALVAVPDLEAALALAEHVAPEHLQLMGRRVEALASKITRAGCLFVGSASGTAFGDYVAGSNHILPTAGAARFASGVSPDHFLRGMAEVRISDPAGLADVAGPLARAEGFELHARSMEARIRDNPPR
jgi:histidinol dehydrogenase